MSVSATATQADPTAVTRSTDQDGPSMEDQVHITIRKASRAPRGYEVQTWHGIRPPQGKRAPVYELSGILALQHQHLSLDELLEMWELGMTITDPEPEAPKVERVTIISYETERSTHHTSRLKPIVHDGGVAGFP